MTALMDALNAAAASQKQRCKVGGILDGLKKADRTDFETAMDNRAKYSAKVIAKVLTETTGISVSADVVHRHRKRECSCDKTQPGNGQGA